VYTARDQVITTHRVSEVYIGAAARLSSYLGVVPGVADGEGPIVGEDLEEALGDGDGLLLGHLGVDPPHVHRPLPGEVTPQHLPRRPPEPTATPAASEELHHAAAAAAAWVAGVQFRLSLKPSPPRRPLGMNGLEEKMLSIWAQQAQPNNCFLVHSPSRPSQTLLPLHPSNHLICLRHGPRPSGRPPAPLRWPHRRLTRSISTGQHPAAPLPPHVPPGCRVHLPCLA